MSLDFPAIRAAHERIRAYIKRTPVLTSTRLDAWSGASLFFKCENFQKDGAFKARAAKLRGISAHIIMPSNSAKVKVRAVESYGARIVFCEPTQVAREAACVDVIAKTGATLIHSFEN